METNPISINCACMRVRCGRGEGCPTQRGCPSVQQFECRLAPMLPCCLVPTVQPRCPLAS
eukprot:57523-Chlamydomonas_euryale.AAC.1